jgi:F-type H+-transporting ATPase subunit gamma
VKAQKNITGMLPYSNALHHILRNLLSTGGDVDMPLGAQRKAERVAVVAFSSDSSFAGSFNANVVKELRRVVGTLKHLPEGNIFIYTIGKKVFEAAKKLGYTITRNFEGLAGNPDYDSVAALAGELMAQFQSKKIDRVEVVYHHFKSAGSQILTHDVFLPLALPEVEKNSAKAQTYLADYIFEPSNEELLAELLPKTLKLRLYSMLLDSHASEHAARVMAMQLATDNADELIGDLTVDYNKSRQQAITNELLDIVGGSMK